MSATQVLAHGSGLDEIAMVVLPLALLGGLLWIADRRARRAAEAHEQDTSAQQGKSGPNGPRGRTAPRAEPSN